MVIGKNALRSASYVDPDEVSTSRVARRSMRTLTRQFVVVAAIVAVLLSLFAPLTAKPAYADEDSDAKDKISEAYNDYGGSFDGAMEKYEKGEGKDDENSFGFVMKRIFGINYMNDVSRAVAAEGYDTPESGKLCNADDPRAGTPLYHNCDIPNITTQFFQSVIGNLINVSGLYHAETVIPTLDSPWFGLPTALPGDGSVPTDPSQRASKYTGLELYGYNLNYTMYRGEWDRINVYTKARAMTNFGFLSSFQLGARSIIDGVAGGLSKAGENVSESLSNGDLVGAVTGFWGGLWGGGMASGLKPILDSSDLNVVNTNAWYRVGYGETLYGQRELNQEELGRLALQNVFDLLNSSSGRKIELPKDFQEIHNKPARPKEKISQCKVVDSKGKQKVVGSKEAPGITEKGCAKEAEKANAKKPKYTWSADGTQTGQSIEEWKKTNKKFFDVAAKYKLSCLSHLDNKDLKQSERISKFYDCLPQGIQDATAETNSELYAEASKEWTKDIMSPLKFAKFFMKNKGANFNSPWMRFVCVNPDGSDMLDTTTGNWISVYNTDGEPSGKCGTPRPPIQNGFFGNGYSSDQKQPGVDTRYARVDRNVVNAAMGFDTFTNDVANFSLHVSAFATRISNTLMNLSFQPIGQVMGIDDLVGGFVKSFTDSIFFSFSVLFFVISVVILFARTAYRQQWRKFVFEVLLGFLVLFMALFVSMKPAMAMKAVDYVPSQVETAIAGAIFGVSEDNDDELCTASGTVSMKDENGKVVPDKNLTTPASNIRSMMCENWRVFTFNPWVYGQWGTEFDNLYAANTDAPSKFKNTNGALVGDAGVQMGNSTTVNNWALYQLDSMSVGTATTRSDVQDVGRINSDMYRIVDAQAGPNNGAGTDSRYFASWSGLDYMGRLGVAMSAIPASIVSMVTIGMYSIYKILIALISKFMLMALPIILTVAMFLEFGTRILKKYLLTLLGLLAQRIALVTLMALLITFIVGFTASIGSFFIAMVASIALCIAALLYRNNLMNMFAGAFTSTGKRSIVGSLSSAPVKELYNKLPAGMKNSVNQYGSQVQGGVSGFIGGYIVGGMDEGMKGAKKTAQMSGQREFRSQRRRGLSRIQSIGMGMDAGKNAAQNATKEYKTELEEVSEDVKAASPGVKAGGGKVVPSSVETPTTADGDAVPAIKAASVNAAGNGASGNVEGDGTQRVVEDNPNTKKGSSNDELYSPRVAALRDKIAKTAEPFKRRALNTAAKAESMKRKFNEVAGEDDIVEEPENFVERTLHAKAANPDRRAALRLARLKKKLNRERARHIAAVNKQSRQGKVEPDSYVVDAESISKSIEQNQKDYENQNSVNKEPRKLRMMQHLYDLAVDDEAHKRDKLDKAEANRKAMMSELDELRLVVESKRADILKGGRKKDKNEKDDN